MVSSTRHHHHHRRRRTCCLKPVDGSARITPLPLMPGAHILPLVPSDPLFRPPLVAGLVSQSLSARKKKTITGGKVRPVAANGAHDVHVRGGMSDWRLLSHPFDESRNQLTDSIVLID